MRLPFQGSYPVNQTFNDPCCRAVYQQAFGWSGHNGIDYDTPAWTPIVAAHSGMVYSGYEAGGYGNFVFITGEVESVYGHLARVTKTSGFVNEGEVIGYSGNTGFSSGPHLHFGVRPVPYNRNNGFGGYIDPQPLFGLNQGNNVTPDQLAQVLNAITTATKQLAEFNADDRREQKQFFEQITAQITVATAQLAQFIGDARKEIEALRK